VNRPRSALRCALPRRPATAGTAPHGVETGGRELADAWPGNEPPVPVIRRPWPGETSASLRDLPMALGDATRLPDQGARCSRAAGRAGPIHPAGRRTAAGSRAKISGDRWVQGDSGVGDLLGHVCRGVLGSPPSGTPAGPAGAGPLPPGNRFSGLAP
jgi:hypothetical protein